MREVLSSDDAGLVASRYTCSQKHHNAFSLSLFKKEEERRYLLEIPLVAQEEQQPRTDFPLHESWTRQQLEEYQAHALQTCRAYACTHSPFYQRFHQGLMECPLQELPVLTKAMVMEHFDELVTDREVQLQAVQHYLAQDDQTRPFLDRYRLTVTSGSTGQPGIFLSNRVEGSVVANTLTRVQTWGGVTKPRHDLLPIYLSYPLD